MGLFGKYTIQRRIVTLMIVFSVVYISAFCVIQVKNQLSAMTAFNIYRTKLSAFVVKHNLEKAMRDNPPETTMDIGTTLQNAAMSLKESGIIENAVIFNKKCEIIVSSGASFEDMKITLSDYRIIEEYASGAHAERWFATNIDSKKRVINLYIPLYKNGGFDYITKAVFSLGNIEEALKQVYIPIIITTVLVIFANILLGSILTKTIAKPIDILNEATREIAGGNLKRKVEIHTRDEIEELGRTFNHMTDALQRMRERAENANPLTKLPGNNVIHEDITRRINAGRKFVVVYSDLDNFKAFNDKYGIGSGDKAITMTADIMRESLKLGGPDDFLGHEGGDDFVLITTPGNVEKITNYVTVNFDKRVRELYKKEDLDQGYIIAHARDGSIQKFPTMTLSLAGVSNEKRPLSSYGEITNICAEVKKKAKSIPKSVFVLDKRVD